MKNGAAGFREPGSFLAGLLIGLSIVLAIFTMMVRDSTEWQALWVCLPLIVLALGLALYAVATVGTRPQCTENIDGWAD